MKNRWVACLALVGFGLYGSAVAVGQGAYVGAEVGTTWPDQPQVAGSTSTTNHHGAFGAQLGYNALLNSNWLIGLEGSYRRDGTVDYQQNVATLSNAAWQPFFTMTYLLDKTDVNLFGKVGYVKETSTLSYQNNGGSTAVSAWIPAIVAGIGFSFLTNLNLFGEWQHNFGQRDSNALTENRPIALDAVALGISYTFPL